MSRGITIFHMSVCLCIMHVQQIITSNLITIGEDNCYTFVVHKIVEMDSQDQPEALHPGYITTSVIMSWHVIVITKCIIIRVPIRSFPRSTQHKRKVYQLLLLLLI